MKISTLYLSAIVLALGCYACKTIPTTSELESLSKVLEIEKGPCYQECPVSTLTIYENGTMKFVGEEYSDKEGTFIKSIGQTELRKLVKAFRDANFFSFQSAYRSNIPDLQTVSITFNDGGNSKTVTGKENRPEELMALQNLLDQIADSDGWMFQGGNDEFEGGGGDEIIVSLVRGVNTDEWLGKYKAQNVQLKDALSPTGNYILITFDLEVITPDDMLELIRNDADVIGAEFNQEVFNR